MKLPFAGFHATNPTAEILFVVCDNPTIEEMIRAEPLVNEDAAAFEKRYLEPLGAKRSDVSIAWLGEDGLDAIVKHCNEHKPRAIIELGGDGDGEIAFPGAICARLPFARAGGVWKNSYAEESTRKLRALRKNLDANPTPLRTSIRPLLQAARPHDGDGIEKNAKVARLYKSNDPKRIVYGVVLDPYQVDLQGDWIPPKDIAETARGFMKNRGYISYQHEGLADAKLVESSVEVYPSLDDERKAEENLPHRAYRRKYGDDVVHSGAWVIGVELSPALWAEYQAGKLNAFSIEGFGTRSPMAMGDMPQVTFVDLEAVG